VKAAAAAAAAGEGGEIEVSVEEYMRRQYGIKLRHPDWPCVAISPTGRVPLELCRCERRRGASPGVGFGGPAGLG
jgi:hypothetical protein